MSSMLDSSNAKANIVELINKLEIHKKHLNVFNTLKA